MKRPNRIQIYRDRKGEWRWRARAQNGWIIAESGEGYSTRSGADKAIRNVLRIFAGLHTLAVLGDRLAQEFRKPKGKMMPLIQVQ